MNLKKRIGNIISIKRKNVGLKQAELAEMCNISTKHQSRVETGVHFPSAELLEKYAEVLNIDVSELLDIKDTNSTENLISDINLIMSKATVEQIKIIHKIVRCIID